MKYLLGLVLAFCLLFAVATTSFASPMLGGAEAGQFLVFGAYEGWWGDFELGAGYAITDNFTLGAIYTVNTGPAVFGNLQLGPIVLAANVWYVVNFDYLEGYASGLYTFDLDPFVLGVGAGFDYGPWPVPYVFATVGANLTLSENFSAYATWNYYFEGGYNWFDVGIAIAL